MITTWSRSATTWPLAVARHEKLLPYGLVLAMAGAEYIFAYQDVGYGILLCLALVIATYVLTTIVPLSDAISRSASSLMLAPTYILLTASLPWFIVNQAYLLPGVYSVILGLVFWHLYRRGYSLRRLRELGLVRPGMGRYAALGLALGVPTSLVEYIILLPSPQLPSFSTGLLLRDAIYMFLFVAVAEELLFRGILQKDLTQALGAWQGLLLTAALFGVMHMSWRSVPELGFTFMAGAMLGYMRWKTGSLAGPLFWHGVNNTLLVSIWPFLLGVPAGLLR